MAGLKLQPVKSSAFDGVHYDADTQELTVQFTSGNQYTHVGVPPKIDSDFRNSPSMGRFYAAHIKGKYDLLKGKA